MTVLDVKTATLSDEPIIRRPDPRPPDVCRPPLRSHCSRPVASAFFLGVVQRRFFLRLFHRFFHRLVDRLFPHFSRPFCILACQSLAGLFLSLFLGLFSFSAGAAPVMLLEVQGAIGPASADYMIRGIAKAGAVNAPLVVIRLDTPGGLDTSMRQIIQAVLASAVPVAVYVSPEGARAASAGTYILYAAHIAAMAPATTLGAATPVAIGFPGTGDKPSGKDKVEPAGDDKVNRNAAPGQQAGKKDEPRFTAPPDAMTAKQVNDAAAFIRGLALQRDRNAEWAERAVREAVSLTASEALQQNVVDVIAADVPDLLRQIDGRTVRVAGKQVKLATSGLTIEAVPPDWRQRLLATITNPSLALILMMIGIYGLMFEFASPGFGVAGTVGAICLLLGLFALQMLPVNYAGLALIALGMALLAAEVLTQAFGIFGAGGFAAILIGGLLLFDSDVPGFGAPTGLIVGLAISSVLVVLLGGNMALRASRRPVVSGAQGMIGEPGTVLSIVDGVTWALIHGERWKVSSSETLVPGQRLRVIAMHGLTLEVRPEPDLNLEGPLP